MIRKLILASLLVAGIAGVASAQWEDPIENTVTSVAATEVGTCANGAVLYDSNGVTWCGSYTTTDPSPGYVNGPDCSSSPVQDATCTAANLVAAAGSDTKLITGITAATCNADGVDIITVVVCGSAQLCTTTTVTQDSTIDSGTDFNCSGTDLACTQGIRDAIATLTGVASVGCPETTGACSTTTIGIQANRSTHHIGSISIAGGCGTANTGTDGKLVLHSVLDFGSSVAGTGGYVITAGDTDTGYAISSGDAGNVYMLRNGVGVLVGLSGISLGTTVYSNNVWTGTQDFRGALSNSTGNVTLGASEGFDLSGTITSTAGVTAMTVSTAARIASGFSKISFGLGSNDGAIGFLNGNEGEYATLDVADSTDTDSASWTINAGATTWLFNQPIKAPEETVTKTSSYVILTTDSGVTFDNVGDGDNLPLQLPPAADELTYRITVATEVAGDDITLSSVGDDTLQLGAFTSGTADCLDVVGLGSILECTAHSATQWICACLAGTCDTTCP